MILVDTSVWIDHLHSSVRPLVDALDGEEVLTHPFVIGELACGTLAARREVLDLLAALPAAIAASDDEVLNLIEQRQLMGRGLGYIDVHLLASAILSDAQFWTRDRRLLAVAATLELPFVATPPR